MRRWLLALYLFIPLSAGCALLATEGARDLANIPQASTQRFLFASAGGSVESFISRPKGQGPFPLMVLLHGHSLVGIGARRILPVAEMFASDVCYASLTISLPGYGDTQVPAGAAPEATRQVVEDAVAMAKKLPWVDGQRVYFYGVSRGAVVAAALVAETAGVKGAVLQSGAYDLPRLYRDTSSYWLRKMLNPNGDSEPKLYNVLNGLDRWPGATLILHGASDGLIPPDQAKLLGERLAAMGKPHRLVLYPDHGHRLPLRDIRAEVVSFLKANGGSACGANDP